MIIKKYFSKSLAFTAVALLSFGLLVSVASAAITTITNVTPNGGVNETGDVVITWNPDSGIATGDKVDIYYSTNDFGVETKLTTSNIPASDGTYTWNTVTAGIPDSNNYKIKVADVNSLVNGISISAFTVDNTAPTFPTVSVNGGSGFASNPVQSDTFNVTIDASVSGLASTRYGFSTNNVCSTGDDWTSSETGSFTSGTDFTIAGNHTDYLCVRATDNAGNVGYQQVGQLNTDNTPPTISSVVGTTIQGAGDTIAIAFSEPVVPSDSIWSSNDELSFRSPSGLLHILDTSNATFVYDNPSNTLTVTLDENTDNTWLKNNQDLEVVTSTNTIEDIAGNFLSASALIISTTSGDTTNPNVALTYSNNGPVKDTDIVTITATFDEALDLTALPNAPQISIAVPGTGSVSSANMTGSGLIWTYDWTVGDGDGTATITADAEDLAGNNNPVESNNTIVVDNTNPTVAVGSYSFDGVAANVFFNPDVPAGTGDTTSLEVTASEPVTWTSLQFQKVGDPSIYKTYPVDSSFDGTNIATQVWDGTLSVGADADVAYEVEAHIIDAAGNDTVMVLSPYTATIDTLDPSMPITSPIANEVVHNTNGDVPFVFSATDTNLDTCAYKVGTGSYSIISCTSPDTLTLNDGRQTVTLKATDKAGNTKTDSVEFVVDKDGILTVDDSPSTTPDFATIQGAIDAWVTGITTVSVADGTYNENVNVDQALVVKSATGASATTITTPTPGGTVVAINHNDVTIDGFTITNPSGVTGDIIGIYAQDHSNLTIKNNTVTQIGSGVANTKAIGIVISSSAQAVNSVAITDNHINNVTSGTYNSASGISIGWTGSSNEITGLIINQNTIDTIHGDITAWSAGHGAYGILINHKTVAPQITNNTITNLEGLWAHGIGLEGDTPNAMVTGNTINNLTDHKSPSDAIAVYLEDNPSAGTVLVNQNKFSAVNVGVALNPGTATGVLDATSNWWGNATGPYNATANPNGLGSDVWPSINDGYPNYVLFNPFYNSDAMNTPVSSAPIDHFVLSFAPTSQTVNANSTLTVLAQDVNNYTAVNHTPNITLTGDNGASFGANLLIMSALGTTDTTVTNSATGDVHVTATEVGGSAAGTGTINFTIGADITAPVISNIQVTSITSTSATITWDTDENATSQVQFGTTSSYGTLPTVDATLVTSHSVVLTGLTNGMVYHFRVISVDASTNANVGTSGDNTFTTTGVDQTPPVITLLGQNPMTLTVGDTFTDPGATANDNVDGDITSNIVKTGTVNTAIVGTYTITYNVTDVAGNHATEETRTVIVTDPAVTPITPTVSINGVAIVSAYTVTEATARFTSGLQFDTTHAASVTVNGSTVTAGATITAATQTNAITLGSHTYNVVVTSSTGDTANITVSYQVTADPTTDTTPPVITLLGQNPMTLTVGDTFTDPGATANDNVDGNITPIIVGGTITDGFVTTTAGTYTVTYDIDDAAGNHAVQETRTVIVNAAFDDTATLAVTGIDAVKTYAIDDDTYTNGWSWTYHITVPTGETQFQMKFSDFISGANSIPAGSNIRFYTAQASANADDTHAVDITATNIYSPTITLDSDLESGTAGRQIDVIVEMKVPTSTPGGSYSGSYGVLSN